jgi:hypothetical protein
MYYIKKYAEKLGKKVRRVMITRKEIQKAQRILDETIETLKGNIKCEVFGYDKKGYKVRFFKKAGKLTGGMRVNIPKEWIEDTSPVDNSIREELESFLRGLEQKPKKRDGETD